MTYTKTTWVSGVTPVSAANQNHLETQYDEAVSDTLIRVVKQADEIVNNSVVLQNDDELLFPVAANEIWTGLFLMRVFTDPAADFKFLFVVPAGAVMTGYFSNAGAVGYTAEMDFTALGYFPNGGVSAFTASRLFYFAYIGAAAAGNVQLQWAQNAADVSDTKLLQGSSILAWDQA